MKNVFKLLLPIIACGIISVFGVIAATSASATTLQESLKPVQCDGCPTDLYATFKQITNIILYIVVIIAIIMVIVGGVRYIVSGGDAKKVTDAKNTVLYAIIGLIVCFLSFIIVNFVISSLPGVELEEEISSHLTCLAA